MQFQTALKNIHACPYNHFVPTANGSDGGAYIFRDKRGKGVRMSNNLRALMSA